ncbi:MAG: 1-acyl-sn-glycerol-3-phosphate acyltransferase [Clostridia bacterium]|nr:1-acyl-sn-glycerol-3-phosphate acyltransferase [Clostridia bacterium]
MKSLVYRIVRFIVWLPVKLLFRVHWQDRGNEPLPESGPYLVCANHQTALDVIFLATVLRRQQPHFMAKAELFKVPVLGWLIRKLGAFPVARGKGDVGAIKHAIKLLEGGRSVGVFPQGTRMPGRELRDCSVKAGAGMIAARAGAQVLPVYIKMKKRSWRFLRRVDVIVGKPIPFADFHYNPAASGEYARITGEIYEQICLLDEADRCQR